MVNKVSIVAALFILTFALVAPRSSQAATVSWCLGQINNSKILPTNACPIVTATDITGGVEVFVTTQADVQLEQFGFEWGPSISDTNIEDITINGKSLGTRTTTGGLNWSLPQLNVQMDGFGQFDVAFDVSGASANAGITGTGFGFSGGGTSGTLDAALYFVIAGLFTVDDFEAIFSPNCNPNSGCLQAAKVSSEQYAELIRGGGFVSNVPLPGAVWLFLAALGSFGVFSRRRRQMAA